MATRITDKDLEKALAELNAAHGFNSPVAYATPGSFTISGAYGGVQLHQIMPDNSGIRVISTDGYGTKRQLARFINRMLDRLESKTN